MSDVRVPIPMESRSEADRSDATRGAALDVAIDAVLAAYDGLPAEARRDPYDRGRMDQLHVLRVRMQEHAADQADSDRRSAEAADDDDRERLARRAHESGCDRLRGLVGVLRLLSLVAPRVAPPDRDGLRSTVGALVAHAEALRVELDSRSEAIHDADEHARRSALVDSELVECRELAAPFL